MFGSNIVNSSPPHLDTVSLFLVDSISLLPIILSSLSPTE